MRSLIFGSDLDCMRRQNKGQMRIVEAMIACTILVVGLSASIYISSVYTVMEFGSIERVAANVVNVLDNTEVMKKVVGNATQWESELRGLVENLLPPDTFYNLALRSALTGEPYGEITNLAGGDISPNVDSVNIEVTVTMSLPLGRVVYKPLDVMLVMDVSGSMNDKLPGDVQTKIEGTIEAATAFIDQLDVSKDQVGLVTFSTEATLRMPLTTDFEAVKSDIASLTPNGYTNIGDGISYATEEFVLNGRDENTTAWVMILLSDGMANRPTGVNATQYALDKAALAASLGIRLYSIGLGAKTAIDEELLKEVVSNGGSYYYAPSSDDLMDIYGRIFQDLAFHVSWDVVVIDLSLMRPR